MEATVAPAQPTQVDFRAQLHEIIDQIQDPDVLRAAVLLLAPQTNSLAANTPEPALSPAWQAQLNTAIQQLDTGQGVPLGEALTRLMAPKAA